MSSIGAAFLADPSNSNVLRQSYVTGFLDVRGNAIIRTDASLSGNIGIGGAVSISNNIGMSGVINQLISIPLQGGFVYQQVNSADALTAIAQVATLNTLVVTGNAVATPALAPYSNPISGNVVTLGTASVNARLGGISNYVMGNLAVLSDVSLNTRLFLGGDASFGGKLSVSSDASFGGRISVGGDISVNGLSLGLGSQSIRTNTVFGNTALQKIQTSGAAGWINNTAVGYQSLLAATTPVNNTAVGSMSLAANTSGANNTAVGYGAGAFVSTGGNITCLGYNTGFSSGATQYNNSTALGYNATIGGSNQVVLGTAAESVIVAGNLAIGKTTTPGFALDVVGNAQFANDVSINGNLAVTGGLSVKQMQSQNIVNMTTTNYQLIVSEDISLNGKLFVSGDVSMGGNLAATSGTSANTYMNVYGKAPPTNVYGNLVVSPNSANASSSPWFNNNITWTSIASTNNSGGYFSPKTAFLTNIVANAGTRNCGWASSSASYNGSTAPAGQYNAGSFFTPMQNVLGAGRTISISGEWLQIQSNLPVVLNNFSMSSYGQNITNVPVSRFPYKFYICGSNDGNSWYPVLYNEWNALPITNAALSSTSTFTLSSLSSNTYPSTATSGTLTYITYGNSSNAYVYFRMVITAVIGSNFGQTSADGANAACALLWKPVFSVATQPGPSRALLYMDPSNINQLDVSGSLALINPNLTLMATVTPNTASAVPNSWFNNGVTWASSASSVYPLTTDDFSSFKAFNTITNNVYDGWHDDTAGYSSGVANANFQTPVFATGTSGTINTYNGQWLQLQSNVPLIISTFFFGARGESLLRLPKIFYIVGSNTGTGTWTPIFKGTTVSTTGAVLSGTVYLTGLGASASGTISNFYGSTALTYDNTYGNTASSFTYFRLIVASLCSSSESTCNIGEWGLTFATTTTTTMPSSVSLALDNAVHNQLNVGGAMNVAGATTVAGAMNVGGAMNVAGTLSLGSGYSATTNGWTTLPGGIILQWGITNVTLVANSSVTVTVTLPISFKSVIFNAVAQLNDPGPGAGTLLTGVGVYGTSLTTITILAKQTNGGANNIAIYWQALGV